jgi:LysM repeat protein
MRLTCSRTPGAWSSRAPASLARSVDLRMRLIYEWASVRFSLRLLFAAAFVSTFWSATPLASAQQHTVRAGQSLAVIARRHRVRVWDLALANDRRPTSLLRPGDVLSIPPRGVTYVQPGQTLSEIAREHEVSVDEIRRLNRLREGAMLRAGQRIVLPGYMPSEEEEGDRDDWGAPSEPGFVHIRRRDAVVSVALLDAQGRVTAEGLRVVGEAMRRHEEDAIEVPHPRLVRLLAAISDHFGGREISLVSGRREAGGYTREASRHVSGQATDIRVEGVPRRTLWEYCRTIAATGCGYYPRSTFVHVDVRDRAAQWVDWSRPGMRASYGNLRGPWRRACSRRRGRELPRGCEREGRSITRPDEVPIETLLTDDARALIPVVPEVVASEELGEEEVLEPNGDS